VCGAYHFVMGKVKHLAVARVFVTSSNRRHRGVGRIILDGGKKNKPEWKSVFQVQVNIILVELMEHFKSLCTLMKSQYLWS